ncbi:hypothetical protein SAMN04489841_1083 [Natrinema salaciae]|uniref:Uncharacterized protein n=1 Tax=Natrinema salaciae TaxID=1186196 RepID=A0A1H9CKS7_9EURY|nr:hypothetical protein SAMN04489841_1083 [Natrinema salaciae]
MRSLPAIRPLIPRNLIQVILTIKQIPALHRIRFETMLHYTNQIKLQFFNHFHKVPNTYSDRAKAQNPLYR